MAPLLCPSPEGLAHTAFSVALACPSPHGRPRAQPHSTPCGSAAFLLQGENEGPVVTSSMQFLENHGKNILLSNSRLTASRVSSYNQGIVVVAQPLPPQQLFQVRPGQASPWPSPFWRGCHEALGGLAPGEGSPSPQVQGSAAPPED